MPTPLLAASNVSSPLLGHLFWTASVMIVFCDRGESAVLDQHLRDNSFRAVHRVDLSVDERHVLNWRDGPARLGGLLRKTSA